MYRAKSPKENLLRAILAGSAVPQSCSQRALAPVSCGCLLSSRLYCRLRNFPTDSQKSAAITESYLSARGLYHRLGLSPDPEELHLIYFYLFIILPALQSVNHFLEPRQDCVPYPFHLCQNISSPLFYPPSAILYHSTKTVSVISSTPRPSNEKAVIAVLSPPKSTSFSSTIFCGIRTSSKPETRFGTMARP